MRLPLHGERGDALQLHGQGGGGGAGGGSSSQKILLLLTNRQLFSQICRQLLYFCFSQTGRQLLYFCFSQIGRYCTSASHRQVVTVLYFCFSQIGIDIVLLLLTDRLLLYFCLQQIGSYCTSASHRQVYSRYCTSASHRQVLQLLYFSQRYPIAKFEMFSKIACPRSYRLYAETIISK